MDTYNALKHIYPSLNVGVDYVLVDNGNGVEIINWTSQDPIPTTQELQVASDAFDAAKVIADADKEAKKAALKAKLKIDDADIPILAEMLRVANS